MNRYILLLTIILFACGCESVNDFRSVAGVRNDLEGSWEMVAIPHNSPAETWTFSGGSFTRKVFNPDGSIQKEEHCDYKVTTTWTTPYVTLGDVPGGSYIVARWIIITLDKKYLTILQNGGNGGATGLLQKEFTKK